MQPEQYAKYIDTFVCTYNTRISQFKYGFYPSSVASLGILGRPIICPQCSSVLDIINNKNNAILYDDFNECSLKESICAAYNMSSCQKKSISNGLKKHLIKQTWEKVVKIICKTINGGIN